MTDARTRASEAIGRAQSELDRAIGEIETIHTFDPALVGLMAHALDNYTTVTAATVEMLQLALQDHEDRDVAVWLKGIAHATDLMSHSVGRLVSLSPPADFQMTLDGVNLAVLMERACEYHRRHRPGDIQIVCRSVGDPRLAWGDRVAIAVVAENLLANAIHATPPHGVIQVEIAAEPGHVVVSVRDPGPGLTDEQRKRIFRMSATAPRAGTGLEPRIGLVIAYQLVQRMDGDLWCDSQLGHGSRFSFRLPAVE